MCELKINAINNFLLLIASILPQSPDQFKIPYILSTIDATSPWNLGGVILELLSTSYDFIRLVIAWKFIQLLMGFLIAKLT
ncbi:hypothetical protein BCD67_24875 [Oscillatoriales cyanobacterium USR001]|nr:hypothetical protein BCD67_24875 [Oscillatoriales cyanobacterium USR001]